MTRPPLLVRQVTAELVGSTFLAAAVVGSGIAGQQVSPGDVGLQLLENAAVTAAVLVALILALGPVSAAFNPLVTIAERLLGAISTTQAALFVVAQCLGCVAGVLLANVMFGLDAVSTSTTARGGGGQVVGEVVASFGLLVVVFGVVRSGRATHVAYAVGAYIGAAVWFTSSTSFANPAITIARTLSDSFAGIAPASAPAFVAAQLAGALLALLVVLVLYPRPAELAADLAALGDRDAVSGTSRGPSASR